MSDERQFDSSQDSAPESQVDSSGHEGTGAEKLPAELAELELCLGALKPDWSSKASSDMLYQVALQTGIEQGREEGRLMAKRSMQRNVWLGSIVSGAAGLAASLLIVVTINGGLISESDSDMAGRDESLSGLVGAEENETAQLAGSDIADETQISSQSKSDDDRSTANDGSSAIGSMRSLASRFSQFEQSGGVGSTQWLLDRGAILDFQTQYVEQTPTSQDEKRSDYLNRRTQMLEDPDVL